MILTILIPAFNEAETIGEVVGSIPMAFAGFDRVHVIVVDDGSTDATAEIAAASGAEVVVHKRNFGLGVVFRTGIAEALARGSDAMVTIDADGQFAPAEIPLLLEPLLAGRADVVSGSRFVDPDGLPPNMPWIKRWGNRLVAALVSLATGRRVYDPSCGFRAYGREALLRLTALARFTYTQETLLELAFKDLHLIEVPITVKYFDERESRVAGSILRYGFRAGNIMLHTIIDHRPLRVFGIFGAAVFLLGFCLDVAVLWHYLEVGTLTPYKAVGFAGAFLNSAGMLIVFVGILANSLVRARRIQEEILYLQRKKSFFANRDPS